ncbi:hypothetical protein [Anaeromicrobium sediminis]|uniref:Uncharacterized protein n=1 Tax=Anaeromicrobium sediminis TaxID=1478221 RepID=A0A267MNL6_9FIRM|nr:hypothetical protein [Anaeromicrobium sediminis]PAB60340.1 hypothetical protein CCE28_05445 [Anaeromicrobium sediminis]
MKKDTNCYKNEYLQFSIRKPDDWLFVPQKWASNFKQKSIENTPEFRAILEKSVVPFVYFYKHHENTDYPYPTVQCGCRLMNYPSDYTREKHMNLLINGLDQIFNKHEILEASPNYIISGKPSIYIKMKFQINNAYNEPIDCLSRSIQVVNNSITYTIGLTGSLKGEYQCEDEFTEIIQSIKIGSKLK